jgi:hypothetical protein
MGVTKCTLQDHMLISMLYCLRYINYGPIHAVPREMLNSFALPPHLRPHNSSALPNIRYSRPRIVTPTASIVVPISTGRDSPKMSAPKGVDVTRLLVAVGVIKLVVDLTVLYIPIPIVMSMNLSKKEDERSGHIAHRIYVSSKAHVCLPHTDHGASAIVADIVDLYLRIEIYHSKITLIFSIFIARYG